MQVLYVCFYELCYFMMSCMLYMYVFMNMNYLLICGDACCYFFSYNFFYCFPLFYLIMWTYLFKDDSSNGNGSVYIQWGTCINHIVQTTTFSGKIIYCIYHWLYLHILPIVINYDICGDAFCSFYPLYNSLSITLHRLLSDHLHLCIMGLFTHDFMIFICLHFRYVGSTTIVLSKLT